MKYSHSSEGCTKKPFANWNYGNETMVSIFSPLGFDAIGDSKYTSDVNWGCMLRSSQMLAAQVWFCFIVA